MNDLDLIKIEAMPRQSVVRGLVLVTALLQGACGQSEETPVFCRNAWTEVGVPPDVALPGGRAYHASIWTGESVLTWGGDGAQATVAAFEPPSSFSVLPAEGSPPPILREAVLLWTGDAAIAFGAPPAVYHQATSQWTPLSDPPGGTETLDAIWTGTQALVEVEVSKSDLLIVDFLALDPATGEWTELPEENAPPIEGLRPLVWTGSELFLWGMTEVIETGEHQISGKRYDPASSTWREVTSEGAPSLRADHTVTWAGEEVVVWGGTSDYQAVGPGTGGRYYPDRDVWEPVSSVGAPSGRRLHQATGVRDGKVAYWGGNGQEYLADGGLYDPASDTWSSITTRCGPPARLSPTLTWTGQELVLWGGLCAEPGCDERERVWTLDEDALFGELPPDDPACECRTLEGKLR